MSTPPPPKPKPGSLRDRIAAFEKPAAAAPTHSPPPPRPKPGSLASSWKPRAPSPPSSPSAAPATADPEHKPVGGGMSASDAKESIGRGGSLKDRMAALQGKGAFGAPAAAAQSPPPLREKPRWKPPPVVSPPVEEEESIKPTSADPAPTSAPEDEVVKQDQDVGEASVDPEDEERERRAAIAARMARLGGARVGIAPPVFGTKPKPAPKPAADDVAGAPSPKSTPSADAAAHEYFPPISHAETVSPDESPAPQPIEHAESVLPPRMPVPAGPRRAAPPRKKAAKPEPAPAIVDEAEAATNIGDVADIAAKTQDESLPQREILGGPEFATKASENVDASAPELITIASAHPDVESGKEQERQEERAGRIETSDEHGQPEELEDGKDQSFAEAKSETFDHGDEEADASHQSGHKKDEHDEEAVSAQADHDDEAHNIEPQSHNIEEEQGHTEEPEIVSSQAPPPTDAPQEHEDGGDEDEDEEVARRKRVAERLARMGGVNPFAPAPVRGSSEDTPPPPALKPSVDAPVPPQRKPSVDIHLPPARKPSVDVPVPLQRKPSVDIPLAPARKPSADTPTPPPPRRKPSTDSQGSAPASAPASQYRFAQPGRRVSVESSEVPERKESLGWQGEDVDVGESGDEHELQREEHHSAPAQAVYRNEGYDEEKEMTPSEDEEEPHDNAPTSSLEDNEPEDGDDNEEVDTAEDILNVPAPPSQEEEQPRLPLTRRSMPPPPRLVPDVPEEQSEDEAPVPIPSQPTSPTRSVPLPPILSPADDEDSPPEEEFTEPLRVPAPIPVPSPPVLELDHAQAEPLRYPSRRSMPPPPRALPQAPLVPDASTRPSRPVPVPAPSPPVLTQVADEDEEEQVLPTPPPRRAVPAPTSPIASEPLLRPTLSIRRDDEEVLDEEEGDPIDPGFHSPSRKSSSTDIHAAAAPEPVAEASEEEEQTEQTRRRTIAERMAKLGGIKFGAAPITMMGRPPPSPVTRAESVSAEKSDSAPAQEQEDVTLELTEEEEEQARKARISAKLAGMGGMRFGMLPTGGGGMGVVPAKPKRKESLDVGAEMQAPPTPRRAVPPPVPRAPEPDPDSEHESLATSEEGIKVEAEESELEEVSYEDAQEEPEEEEAPPPIPTRAGRQPSGSESSAYTAEVPRTPRIPTGRPPIPTSIPQRRPSVQTTATATSRKSSVESGFSQRQATSPGQRTSSHHAPQSEYVIVDEPGSSELDPPPPPPRPTSRTPAARGAPFAPHPAADLNDSITSSQWELPTIPSSSLDFGGSTDLSVSSWSDDSTSYPAAAPSSPPPPLPAKPAAYESSRDIRPKSEDLHLSPDDLMTLWGRVGVQVCEVATALYERSKNSLIGDGSYDGFVQAVLSEVPSAAQGSSSYGYVIYVQNASAVQKRISDILPGDITVMWDAKFKGHKGIHLYQQNVGGNGEPLVGVVSEFEPKKSKIKLFHANQHVGQQTVEAVSYRLEDLKSGEIKVFRVLEA